MQKPEINDESFDRFKGYVSWALALIAAGLIYIYTKDFIDWLLLMVSMYMIAFACNTPGGKR